MSHLLQTFTSARDLPDLHSAESESNPFMKNTLLEILEKCNPCHQSYYISTQSAESSIIVSYKLALNLLTYIGLTWKYTTTIIGLPFSVGFPGFTIPLRKNLPELIPPTKGFTIVLNAPDLELIDFGKGATLPSCILDVKWDTFSDYLESLRSHHRYRIKNNLKRWDQVETTLLSHNDDFDHQLYNLYLEVYKRSDFKLEKLSMEYFRTFPADIFTFRDGDEYLGFMQLFQEDDRLIFLFAGINYPLLKQYDVYQNLLLEIVKLAIDRKCKIIDFGQTGEALKMKLGCELRQNFIYARHSNVVLNAVLKKLLPLFSYRIPKMKFRVFRETGQ